MIQRHILGLETITSPYKLVAADINNDQIINGIDLVELRKLILGVYTELPQNDSWRFVNTSMSMDAQYPWPLNEIRMIFGLANDMMQEDFIGVKVGDINGSAITNINEVSTSKSTATALGISYQDKTYVEGEHVTMQFTTDEIVNLSGLQFTLNTAGLEVVNVTANGLDVSEENYAVLSEDKMTFSWNTSNSFTGNELFTVHFKATNTGKLSQNVSLTSDTTPAEAYAGNDLRIIPITLIGQDNSEQEFALYQNTPNPVRGTTNISFNLPKSSKVTLTITDVAGKLVYTESGMFQSGLNSVSIDVDELNTTGVFYYKLATDENSASMKMIVLK